MMTYLGLSSDCSCAVSMVRKGRMTPSLGTEDVSCSSVLSLSADSSPWILWTSGGLCTLDLCGNDGAAAGAAVATDGALHHQHPALLQIPLCQKLPLLTTLSLWWW